MSRNKKLQKPEKKKPLPEIIAWPSTAPAAGSEVTLPKVTRQRWAKCLAEGNGDAIAKAILEYLQHFERQQYSNYGTFDVSELDEFMVMLYMFFTTPFKIAATMPANIVGFGHIIQSIAAASRFGTTDFILHRVMSMPANAWKIMCLLNPRCEVQVPVKQVFDAEPGLATMWYNAYILGISQPTIRTQHNLCKHFENIDDRWSPPNPFVSCSYFNSTYFCPDHVKRVKGVMNRAIKAKLQENNFLRVNNTPDPKSIAIVTNKWHRNHAVYKSAGPLVEQLVGQYKLTLIHTLDVKQETLCTEKFDRVCQAYFSERTGKFYMPPELKDNDFQLIYYPDIGMSNESIWMACARLAPIQMMGYGHPDTTGDDSEIDYIISSADTEADGQEFYSEKMIRIPGLAQTPAWPTYERKNNWKPLEEGQPVRVNCVWGPDKYNYTMLTVLAEINRLVGPGKHVYHFFMSPGANRYGAFIPFKKDVQAILPNVVFHNEQEYYDYMENAEQHDLAINSFPFGGYNTLVEALYLGMPYTTLKGNRFYNAAGAWLLDKVGFPELASSDVRSFIMSTVELIRNTEWRESYRKRLTEMNLRDILFNTGGNTDFLSAIQYILANHPLQEGITL